MKTNRIYLCGGAMHYQDLIDCFNEEFSEVAQLIVLENPETIAVKGYLLNSLRMAHGRKKSVAGIDIGNSTTIVSTFDESEIERN
jgi:plasmid segregation protein ParM